MVKAAGTVSILRHALIRELGAIRFEELERSYHPRSMVAVAQALRNTAPMPISSQQLAALLDRADDDQQAEQPHNRRWSRKPASSPQFLARYVCSTAAVDKNS